MASIANLKVDIIDLCALVKLDEANVTVLFPECHMPVDVLAADPIPEHRLAVEIPWPAEDARNPFDFPADFGPQIVRRVTTIDPKTGAERHAVLWFPTDIDLAISGGGNRTQPDISGLAPYLTSFDRIYQSSAEVAAVDRRLLVETGTDALIPRILDGRLFIETGALTPIRKTEELSHWDNIFDEGNRSEILSSARLAEDICWEPMLEHPELVAKRFAGTSWQTVVDLAALGIDHMAIINAPTAHFLALPSWYKFDRARNSPELLRSKHFLLMARLSKSKGLDRDVRIPYFKSPPVLGSDGPSSSVHPPACPPGYFTSAG